MEKRDYGKYFCITRKCWLLKNSFPFSTMTYTNKSYPWSHRNCHLSHYHTMPHFDTGEIACNKQFLLFSPLTAKPKGTLGLHSVRLSVCRSVSLSVRQSVRQSVPLSVHSISFLDFFATHLQIFT